MLIVTADDSSSNDLLVTATAYHAPLLYTWLCLAGLDAVRAAAQSVDKATQPSNPQQVSCPFALKLSLPAMLSVCYTVVSLISSHVGLADINSA